MTPKVSILIPVYNIQDYLERCLESCINQTLEEIEVVCVNDGSTDDSLNVLNDYAKKDSRIKIITKQNGGLPSSRNVGLNNASGEYILFLDGDDYIELNTCEKLYTFASNKNANIVIFGGIVEPKEKANEWLGRTLAPSDCSYEKLTIYEFLHAPYMFPFIWRNFVKREFIEYNHFRLDEQVVIGEDLAFQFKLLPLTEKVYSIKEKFYHYDCSRTGSLTNNQKYSDPTHKINKHLFLLDKLYNDWKD